MSFRIYAAQEEAEELECDCAICRSATADGIYEKTVIRNHVRGELECLADFQERWQ